MPWPNRTGIARVVAHRDYKIELSVAKLIPRFAARGSRIDIVNVFQYANRKRVYFSGRRSSGAVDLEALTAGTPQQILAEDAARRIAGAEKQNFDWL
jgi:hypothetical protein